MRAALSKVLGHHPRARQVMPSLAVIERALARGRHALERVPLPWVRDASTRLDALVGDWSSDGLGQLRDHLRRLCDEPAATESAMSTQPDSREVEVSETSLSRFFEADEMLVHQVEALRQRPA